MRMLASAQVSELPDGKSDENLQRRRRQNLQVLIRSVGKAK